MARPLRIAYEHALYHVTIRGNEKRIVFRDDFDRDMFLDSVRAAYDRFRFIIHAFVLMDNHVHFLMETPTPNLAACMRHIVGVYTQAFNRRHKRVGHLFQGRYKSIVVEREDYYLELIRYIHLNPWRAKMVSDIDAFMYSGHRAIVDRQCARRWHAWYDGDAVMRQFGRRKGEALKRYRAFIEAGKGMTNPIEKVIGGYALGSRDFADWLWEEFIEGRDVRELSGASSLRTRIDAQRVISAVSGACNIGEKEIFKKGTNRTGANVGRGMTLYILYRHSGMTQREIGDAAGGMTRTAVSEVVRRFERTLAENDELKQRYGCVMKTLGLGESLMVR